MSLVYIRSYFRNIAIKKKFIEHKDVFNIDNIPSTKYEKAFHIQTFDFRVVSQNQMDLVIDCPVEVRLFYKGYRETYDGFDKAIIESQNYFKECLLVENRLTQSNIKNVSMQLMNMSSYAASNDNLIVATLTFTVRYIQGIEECS